MRPCGRWRDSIVPVPLRSISRGCATREWSGGYILLLVMVFLLLLAIIAGTSLRVSALEFRLAGNDQFREQALQRALGIARALALRPAHFPPDLPVGHSLCGQDSACARPILPAPVAGHALPEGSGLEYRITRRGPLFAPAPDLRLPQARASGAGAWRAANFELQVAIDGTAVGFGSAEIVQGVTLLLPTAVP